MSRHAFSFLHGEDLTTMGATWFVSRAYHEYVDKSHVIWQKVKTYPSRDSVFKRVKNLHRYYLKKIEEMGGERLNKNKIGLNGNKTKELARETLRKL